ncbi:acyl carrier protein [bacterium]|nr:acyl carrier protein [bacterium]
MKKEEFLVELEDVLQREEPCNETDILEEYDEWDSLSKMAIMAFYSKNFGINVTLNDLKELKTVEDLIKLAGDKIDA